MLARALSRLEVGQVGVISYGESGRTRLLHALDAPFSDEAGPGLVSQFTFAQDNTIADRPMVELVGFLQQLLAQAGEGVGSGTSERLQQLVLIVADGRFHEKESLRRAIRDASEQPGVLLAFIVLDNPEKSLLDMQSVSFAKGKPVFTQYMDSFPFPYYIVLRDITALPRTLADLLRQWFEMTAQLHG